MKKENLVVVMCPPLSDYPEAPKDQSYSELFDCPKCDAKMWLSDKKKGVLMLSSCLNTDILLACYPCIEKEVKANPEMFRQNQLVNL